MDHPLPDRASAGPLDLGWLPPSPTWAADLKTAEQETDPALAWAALVGLANTRMDFIRTARLDRTLRQRFEHEPPAGLGTKPVRLAVLGSSTLAHLLPAIRVAALRRNIWLAAYEADYGQDLQELNDSTSTLHGFAPTTGPFAFDTPHLMRGADPAADAAQADATLQGTLAHLTECWRLARAAFRCPVIQQTALPVFPALLGNNEHRLPGSPARLTPLLNTLLRDAADQEGMDLLGIDARVATDGLARWHDPALWHRAKQEISPVASPLYGDLVARLVAARQGRSFKCLVLDLDNTLWGGVIGDDGLDGIVLGQGSALGRGVSSRSRPMPEPCPAAASSWRWCSEERRGERAGPVRAAPGHGAEAERYRQLRCQLGRQGRQHPRGGKAAQYRPGFAGIRG